MAIFPFCPARAAQVALEAEHWDRADSSGWSVESAYRDASNGRYIMTRGVFESRAQAVYRIRIEQPDTYYVFMRTWATNPGDNGVFITLNGRPPDNDPHHNSLYFFKENQWDWRTKILCGQSCHHLTPAFYIKEAGEYTLVLGVKELEAVIDKIVLKNADIPPEAAGPAAAPAPVLTTGPNLRIPAAALILIGSGLLLFLRRRRPVRHSRHSRALQAVIGHIRDHYHEEITLAHAAKAAGLSENYLGKIFKTAYGKSFVQYLNDFRIDKALDLMKNTAMNVTEIHYKVGIRHSSYFAKLFKQKTGVSPSEEIKKYRT